MFFQCPVTATGGGGGLKALADAFVKFFYVFPTVFNQLSLIQ